WQDSAAITNANHPGLLSLILIHVNMTDGLFDIEMCVSNLRELLADLDTRWPRGSCVVIEQSQLRSVSASLFRLMPSYLSLKGNPISTLLIPPEIFEIEGLTDFGTDIREPPRNVSQPSSTLTTIYMYDTDIVYFWPWVENLTQCQPILAGESLYCSDSERIANGAADSFTASPSTEYSVQLKDPANGVAGGSIWSAVGCSSPVSGITGLLYPLVDEISKMRSTSLNTELNLSRHHCNDV
ncbi:hypothetical protein GN958_ATG05355, partial [Phytophthora infestans]